MQKLQWMAPLLTVCVAVMHRAPPLPAQDAPEAKGNEWSPEELAQQLEGFQREGVQARLQTIAHLLAHRDAALPALCTVLHGNHKEYLLEVQRLIDQLTDERWLAREEAERKLVEVGARARALLEQRARAGKLLEERVRCTRILAAIDARGTEREERETRLLRGLAAAAAYLPPDARLRRSLVAALGHTDPLVVEHALRALGRIGGDDEAPAVRQMFERPPMRQAALAALARMPGARSAAEIEQLLRKNALDRESTLLVLRILRERPDAAPLVAALGQHADRLVALGARTELPQPAAGANAPLVAKVTLVDRTVVERPFLGLAGDTVVIADVVEGVRRAEIPFADVGFVEFTTTPPPPPQPCRMFLAQGTLLTGELVSMDPESVLFRSPLFGEVRVPHDAVQGLALDAKLDRLLGASHKVDRVRLRDDRFLEGNIRTIAGGKLILQAAAEGKPTGGEPAAGEQGAGGGPPQEVPLEQIAGILLTRPQQVAVDTGVYTRLELTTGDRLLGHVAAIDGRHLVIVTDGLGAAVVPLERVARMEFRVGGGAVWGFTLIADYADSRVVELDDHGREVFAMNDVYGAWDVECLDNGNLLITEFAVSQIKEVTRNGEIVWFFDELKNPYDADRLPNGNTLIADTFGGRVIEVSPDKKVVWEFSNGIKPYDADRLPNGNTLIADFPNDRVLEVSPAGDVVWEVRNLKGIYDADRLPNGNTLVTLRTLNRVQEITSDGTVVATIENLSAPSDADRLPNGNTLVAESGGVREFDRAGVQTWAVTMNWAVEVNRY